MLEVELPGVMVSTLEPSALISDVTWLDAPSPRPTVRMTPAMPMRMPSTVRNERSRWLRTPFTPVRMVSSQLTGRSALEVALVVLGEQPVADADDAPGRRGDLDVVGDQHERASGVVQLAHEPQHVGGGHSSRGCPSARRPG